MGGEGGAAKKSENLPVFQRISQKIVHFGLVHVKLIIMCNFVFSSYAVKGFLQVQMSHFFWNKIVEIIGYKKYGQGSNKSGDVKSLK